MNLASIEICQLDIPFRFRYGHASAKHIGVSAFSKVLASLDKLAAMRKNRKDPQGILRVIGCEGDDFPAIEQALSRHLDAHVRILVSPHPELGMDVDKPSDFELASSLLARE